MKTKNSLRAVMVLPLVAISSTLGDDVSIDADGTPPFAAGSTVTLSVSGAPPELGGNCCDNSKWTEDGNPTYDWGDDASGSGSTATLDTTLDDPMVKDEKSASVTVAQPWKCVDGSSSSTDASASGGPWEVWPTCGEEMFDSDIECCVDGELQEKYRGSNPTFPSLPGSSSRHRHSDLHTGGFGYFESEGTYPRIERAYTYPNGGRWGNVLYRVSHERLGPDYQYRSSFCGGGLPLTGSITYKGFDVEVRARFGVVDLTANWSRKVDQILIPYSSHTQGENDVWMFGEVFGVTWTLTSARLYAVGYCTTTNSPNGSSVTTVSQINGDIVSPEGHVRSSYVEGNVVRMCCK